MSRPSHVIDRNGDMLLKLNVNGRKLGFQVCSRTLRRVSLTFDKAFSATFANGIAVSRAIANGQIAEYILVDDKPEALTDLLNILHTPFDEQLRRDLNLKLLYDITVLADKYRCVDAVRAFAMQLCLGSVATVSAAIRTGQADWSIPMTDARENVLDEEVRNLFQILFVLDLPEKFHELYKNVMLGYKPSLERLRPTEKDILRGNILDRIVDKIRDTRLHAIREIQQKTDQVIKGAFEVLTNRRDHDLPRVLGAGDVHLFDFRGDAPSCSLYSTSLMDMLGSLSTQTGWPVMVLGTNSILECLHTIARSMRRFDDARFARAHDCPSCRYVTAGLWATVQDDIVDYLTDFCADCACNRDMCRVKHGRKAT